MMIRYSRTRSKPARVVRVEDFPESKHATVTLDVGDSLFMSIQIHYELLRRLQEQTPTSRVCVAETPVSASEIILALECSGAMASAESFR